MDLPIKGLNMFKMRRNANAHKIIIIANELNPPKIIYPGHFCEQIFLAGPFASYTIHTRFGI